jgi:hypothetical protein
MPTAVHREIWEGAVMVRIIAAVSAFVSWAALALQLALIIDNLGPALGLWRFVGYFTILTNVGVATVSTAVALGGGGMLGGARARLMAAASIAIVGLVYSLALRHLWNPTGLQKIADTALHDVTPLLFLAVWILAPHPRLAWREIGWGVVPPILYTIYALGRGALDGWYAYWFLNPSEQSPVGLLSTVAVLSCGTALVAGVFVFLDRLLPNRSARERTVTASQTQG